MVETLQAAADVAAKVEALPKLVNDDAVLLRRGRMLTVDILLEIASTPYYVSIERGRIVRVERGPNIMLSLIHI